MQGRQRLLGLAVQRGEHDLVGVQVGMQVLIAKSRLDQRLPRLADQRIEVLLLDRICVDLQQQIGAAFQIQPQMHLSPGHEAGQPAGPGPEIGQAEQYSQPAEE